MAQQFFKFHSRQFRANLYVAILFFIASLVATQTRSDENELWSHGIAMYGTPNLPASFTHLPYVNPNAPKGGEISSASVGSFDSVNSYVLKGSAPWQLRFFPIAETLMGRSLDEPFSLYGLLAHKIRTGKKREWVEFELHPDAAFSDGSRVTVDDVIWSFETLGTVGHPRYHGFSKKIERIEATGPSRVKISFNTEDQELALIAGLRPILKKEEWEAHDLSKGGLDVIPITSGPYVISEVQAGRVITLERNPNYWGKNIPFRKGTANLDKVRLEFFTNETAAFEALKSGEVNIARENSASRWAERYQFPAVKEGDIKLSEVSHQRPSGMTGFAFNLRKPLFADWRVREALITAFNFEFINNTLTGSTQSRITSYWSNSPLSMTHTPATGQVRKLLEAHKDVLLPGALEGYRLPVSGKKSADRKAIRTALDLLRQAGWTIDAQGMLRNASGEPFNFTVLLRTGAQEPIAMMEIYAQSLARLGITLNIDHIDSTQYKQRIDDFSFDMTYYRVGMSLSPGNEQFNYFGSESANTSGGRNITGLQSLAVEGLIHEIVNSDSQENFVFAVQAFDRLLMSSRLVIPIYQWNVSRIAHDKHLQYPSHLPIFGDWPGWEPDVWWWEESQP